MSSTTTDVSANDAAYIYESDDYFAFVESIDPLRSSNNPEDPMSDAIDLILRDRESVGLTKPGRAIWLDCVQAEYFMRLPWKDVRCEIGDLEHSASRRTLINQLDRNYFRVALLLANPSAAAEGGTIEELARASWHRVVLSSQQGQKGLPVLVAPDFDLENETRQMRRMRYLGQCSLLEQRSLVNAFSLDFLPNAKLDDIERDSPISPPLPPSRKNGGIERPIEEIVQDETPTLVYAQTI